MCQSSVHTERQLESDNFNKCLIPTKVEYEFTSRCVRSVTSCKIVCHKKFNGSLIGELELLIPNIALNGNATQSSTFHHMDRFDEPDKASYAIDGKFGTGILDSSDRCAVTQKEYGAWWQVDLQKEYEIKKVSVTTRKMGKSLGFLSIPLLCMFPRVSKIPFYYSTIDYFFGQILFPSFPNKDYSKNIQTQIGCSSFTLT